MYNEPKTLNVAFDVIGDIVLSAASQQYGGFTVPSVDLLLEPYAERSYKMMTEKYTRLGLDADTVEKKLWRTFSTTLSRASRAGNTSSTR